MSFINFPINKLASRIQRLFIITSLSSCASFISIPFATADVDAVASDEVNTAVEVNTGLDMSNEKGVDSFEVATSAGGANKKIYRRTFFDQYLPQNAREMIDKIPGFSFDPGSNERGFGGNAGNVLIDGARPTSKSGGLHGALVRIPAEQVERIEILRGGVGAGEASGQAIIANVIRKSTGSSGTWALKFRRAPEGETLPNLEAAINTQLGDWQTAFDTDIGGGPGYRSAVIESRDANNLLTDSAKEDLSDRGKWIFVNGEGSTEIGDGLLTLNGRLGGDRYTSDTHRDIFDGRLPDNSQFDSFWDLSEKRDFKVSEFGIDWVQTNDDWKWHIIGLGLINDISYQNQFNYQQFEPEDLYESSFNKDTLKTEIINRVTYGYVGKDQFKPEFGIEVAKNSLKGDASYVENGNEVELDGSDIEVTELRSEIFASFVYPMSEQLSIEGGITGEFSQIKVSGDATNQQNFQFLKPRLSTIYKINKTNQLTIEIERKIGQLNLEGFAANVQTSDDNVTSGNPDIAPDKSNNLSVVYDRTFSERGSLKFNFFHQWRQDVLEQIELFDENGNVTGTGIGNAGSAKFWGLVTDINLPLDWLLKNGLVEMTYGYRDSSYKDPIVGDTRTINFYTPKWTNIKLRQDVTEHQFSWGLYYWSDFTDTNHFVDEKETFSGNKRFGMFIETNRFFGLKTQLEIMNINTGDFTRSRYLYDGNRYGEYQGSEIAYRHRKPEIKLSVWGTF